jgi:CBS domain-containing protein
MLTVRDVIARDQEGVHTITADASVQAAIQVMSSRRISALPVMDGERLIGIVSERDYVRKVASQRIPAWSVQVGEIMTPDVITVTPDDSISHCMKLMSANRIRHLPVLAEGRLAAMVSITDVVRALDATLESP